MDAAGQTPSLLARLAPHVNPLNYRIEVEGLGSNLGNVKIRYAEAAIEEAVAEAEHLPPSELPMPPLSDKVRTHIFEGDVSIGKSRGWHYERTGNAAQGTYVIESTRSVPDRNGVYEANVMIQGIKKGPRSSFFPRDWTQDEVVMAVQEAYQTRQPTPKPGRYRGRTATGIDIELDIDPRGQIQTAYPIYQEGI
jgi:hypothetical protein